MITNSACCSWKANIRHSANPIRSCFKLVVLITNQHLKTRQNQDLKYGFRKPNLFLRIQRSSFGYGAIFPSLFLIMSGQIDSSHTALSPRSSNFLLRYFIDPASTECCANSVCGKNLLHSHFSKWVWYWNCNFTEHCFFVAFVGNYLTWHINLLSTLCTMCNHLFVG